VMRLDTVSGCEKVHKAIAKCDGSYGRARTCEA
jgi:hypothetical protein